MGRSLYGDPQRAIAGQRHGLTGRARTYIAAEKIYPGEPVFGMVGDNEHCYRSHINAVTLTVGSLVSDGQGGNTFVPGNLVADNKIAVAVNGVALPVVAFVETTEKTLAAIVREIALNSSLGELGITAFVVEGANAITIVGPGVNIAATATVTEGASQAIFNSIADTNMKFIGVAEHTELCTKNGTGYYDVKDAVNVYDLGDINVLVADGANPADKEAAYINVSDGVFTDISNGNYDCGCYFRSNKQDGLALIEVRGMK